MEQLLARLGEIGLTRLSGPAIVGLRVLTIAVVAWIIVAALIGATVWIEKGGKG